MARALLTTALLAAALVAAHAAGDAPAAGSRTTTYEQLATTSGQWDIAVEASPTAGAPFAPVACTAPTGCPPPLTADAGSALRFTLTRKASANATTATKDGEMTTLVPGTAPTMLMMRACFTRPSQADRPWRRSSPIVDKDRSCLAAIAPPMALTPEMTSADAKPLVFEYKIPKNAPKAAWYASALFECGADKALCAHESTNNTATWQTEAVQSRPASLVAAASVCSAVGPAVLAAFFLKDNVFSKKK